MAVIVNELQGEGRRSRRGLGFQASLTRSVSTLSAERSMKFAPPQTAQRGARWPGIAGNRVFGASAGVAPTLPARSNSRAAMAHRSHKKTVDLVWGRV